MVAQKEFIKITNKDIYKTLQELLNNQNKMLTENENIKNKIKNNEISINKINKILYWFVTTTATTTISIILLIITKII